MPSAPNTITEPGLIVGEGKDEAELFSSLLDHLGINGVRVEEYRGKQRLVPFLRDLPDRAGFDRLRRICITRDVDHPDDPHYQSIDSILQSLDDALRPRGLPSPNDVEVVVGQANALQIGVFLMPGGRRDGALEDLCLEAIADDLASPCIDAYFQCLDACGIARPTLKTMISKARIHAWLASREEADLKRMGEAAANKYIPWNHAAFDPLKTFLLALFDVPPQP